MISKEEYDKLIADHKEGCKTSDYSKMIMIGSEKDRKVKEYEQQFCKHTSVEEIQGGQIERCRKCGKTWS